MAWQEKTFTWGSFASGSELNAYVLELRLTENHVDKSNNYSEVSYSLVLKSGSINRFQCDVTSTLKFNGEQVGKKTENKYLDYNSSWTLLSGTVKKIPHNADGTLNMQIEVSIDTTDSNAWAPPDKDFSVSWPLTKIARASTISGAARVDLGSACSITWTPNSAAFGYKLRFYMKNASGSVVWEKTTDPIHPNKTTSYTYNQTDLPLDLAQYITGSDNGLMGVVLATYSEAGCKTYIGEDDASFYVVVPENESTRPIITKAQISQIKGFNGKYLQGRTQVEGVIEASGQYGATVIRTMTVQGKQYSDPWRSEPVTETGKVILTATDSRGFATSQAFDIEVIPYSRPTISASAMRCKADGTPDESGEHLQISATVDFAPIDGENSVTLWYCYRAENAEGFTEEIEIPKTVKSGVAVTSDVLMNGTLRKDTAYVVRVIAKDAVGEKSDNTIRIASEAVYLDKPAGGDRMGVGGYCEGPGLTAHWDVNLKKNLSVDGELKVGDKLRVGGEGTAYFSGVYIGNVAVSGTNQLRIQTQIMITSASRQSIFLFGFDNYMLVQGVVGALNTGAATWNGTEGISVEMDKDGVVTITMPHTAYDRFVAISGDTFNFV